jgi:hypothetical protein
MVRVYVLVATMAANLGDSYAHRVIAARSRAVE